jgi:hypothetical protein
MVIVSSPQVLVQQLPNHLILEVNMLEWQTA